MSSDYHISLQYQGKYHHIDLHADKTGSVMVGGKRYSVIGDDQDLVDLAISRIRQNHPSSADDTVKAISSIGEISLTPAETALAARMDIYCKSFEQAGFTGSVLVEKEEKVLLAQGYGTTGVVAGTPFYLASLSKQFTAAAIMQLMQEGKIQLHKSINEYLPDNLRSEKWEEVTVHHLLSHTSGIHNFTESPEFEEKVPKMTVDTMLQEEKEKGLEFSPGSQYQYSNTEYTLLGKIIAYVSDLSYNEYIETKLLQPAGMTQSKLQQEGSHTPDPEACKGHKINADGVLVEHKAPDFHMLYGSGSIISTVTDLAKWSRVLDGNHPEILSKKSIDLMTTPYKDESGYGLFIQDQEERQVITHMGGLFGFLTTFDKYPKEKAFITVLCNTEDFDPGYMRYHLEKMALDGASSFAEPIDSSKIDFSLYVGTFDSTTKPGLSFTFSFTESKHPQVILQEEGTPPFFCPASPLSNEHLFLPSQGLELNLTDKGTILVYRQDKVIDELLKKP